MSRIVKGDALQRISSAGFIISAILVAASGLMMPLANNPTSDLQEMLKPLGEHALLTQLSSLLMVTVDGQRYLASMLGEDAQWVRNVRATNGKAVLRSCGYEEVYLEEISADQRVPLLKAYLQAAPVVPIFPAVGMFTPAAEVIDHNAPHPTDPVPGTTVEYGRYLSAICAGCHGNGIGNVVKKMEAGGFYPYI